MLDHRVHRLAVISALILGVVAPAHAQDATPDCTAQVDVEMIAANDDVPTGPVLAVTMACRSSAPVQFAGDGSGLAAVLKMVRDGADRPVDRDGSVWRVSPEAGVATLRYRLDLGALARAISSVSVAVSRGEGVLAIASTWLVEPRLQDVTTPAIDIAVKTPPDTVFLAGLPERGGVWRLRGTTVRFVGYTVFGRVQAQRLPVPPPAGAPPGEP
ncbi:MAG TPA: hypothetical protein VJR58_11475, partial [Vineibacter sp.]|nr:hypothetical protein [Vineibacter sp.]